MVCSSQIFSLGKLHFFIFAFFLGSFHQQSSFVKCLKVFVRFQNKWKTMEEGCIMDGKLHDGSKDDEKNSQWVKSWEIKLHNGWDIRAKAAKWIESWFNLSYWMKFYVVIENWSCIMNENLGTKNEMTHSLIVQLLFTTWLLFPMEV